MAYFDKYIFEFTDNYGGDWRARILEDGFGGSATTYTDRGAADILSLEWQGGRDIYAPIIPSIANLNLIAKTDFEFRDIVSTDPTKIKLIVEYHDGSSWVRKWKGYHVPDIYREDFEGTPYQVQLRFIDGLGLLKNIEYNPISGGRETVSDVIDQILDQIEPAGSWDQKEFINIHETSTTFSDSDTVLTQHYIDERAYQKGERSELDGSDDVTNTVTEYVSCYEALRRICESFVARCWIDVLDFDGTENEPSFNIMSVNYIGESDGSIIAKSLLSSTTASIDLTKTVKLSGSEVDELHFIDNNTDLDYYQPRRLSIAEYNPDIAEDNLITNGNFEFSDTTPMGAGFRVIKDWTPVDTSIQMDWKRELGGLALRDGDRTKYITSPSTTFSNVSQFNILFDLNIDLPTTSGGEWKHLPTHFWVSFEIVLTSGGTEYRLEWTEASGWHFTDTPIGEPKVSVKAKKENTFLIEFDETVTSPVSSGSIFVRLFGVDDTQIVRTSGQKVNRTADPKWAFFKVEPELNENIKGETGNAEVSNDSNAPPLELELQHSDGSPAIDRQSFSLNDTDPLTQTENWNINSSFFDYDNDLSHPKIVARERMKQYADHKRRLKGSLFNNKVATFSTVMVVPEGGTSYGYIFYKFKWSLKRCIVSFEAFESLHQIGTPITFDDAYNQNYNGFFLEKLQTLKIGKASDFANTNYTPTVNENNFEIPPSAKEVTFNPCGLSDPAIIYLPDIDEIDEAVTIKIKCDGCSNKSVFVATSADDSSSIAGSSEIELLCGETVRFNPTSDGWELAGASAGEPPVARTGGEFSGNVLFNEVSQNAISAPANPPNSQSRAYLSDGTGGFNEGDEVVKYTDTSGNTETWRRAKVEQGVDFECSVKFSEWTMEGFLDEQATSCTFDEEKFAVTINDR